MVKRQQIKRMQSLRDKGQSYRVIAERVGCSASTVRRYVKSNNQPAPFTVESGRQQTVDSARLLTFDRNTYWANLERRQKLTLFDSIYHSQELAQGAVNIITRFANSRMLPLVDNPQVVQRMLEIWREIDGHTVNAQLIRQSLISGFACGEWVSEDFTKMDRVVIPPSIEIRKIPNRQGQIQAYVQLPGFMIGRPTSIDGRRQIPPAKMIDVIRDPLTTFDYYGESLFSSALDQFESLAQIMDAEVRVMLRAGRPRFHFAINAEGLTPEQFQDRIDKTKAAFANLGDLDSADLYTAAGVEIKIIGAEAFGKRFSDEIKLIISNILAAIGIPPALLHVSIQSSAGAESYARQSIIAMQTLIDEIQRSIASAWNKSFWQMVQKMERLPVTPVMGFEKPRLLEQSIEETARDLRFNNDLREVTFGIRPIEWLVQRVGATSVDDINALKQQVVKARQEVSNSPAKKGDENKADSNTKITDERATKNVSL